MEIILYCISCRKTNEEIKLYDAIKDSRPVTICESCSKFEDVLVLRKPTTRQLNSQNSPQSVYNRLKRMAGLKEEEENPQKVNLNEIINQKVQNELSDYSIKKRQEIAEKINKPTNLITHYDWIIRRERMRKGLSERQLAEAIGESEDVIKMFEKGNYPDDVRKLAEKLQQFFNIKIIKSIREIEDDEEKQRIEEARKHHAETTGPSRIIKLDQESLDNLTIADLKAMKAMKENQGTENEQVRTEKDHEKNSGFKDGENKNLIPENNQPPRIYKGHIEFLED